MGDVMNDVVLQDKQIQKIDLALEKIMRNDSNGSSSGKDDGDDDDYDGNEWND